MKQTFIRNKICVWTFVDDLIISDSLMKQQFIFRILLHILLTTQAFFINNVICMKLIFPLFFIPSYFLVENLISSLRQIVLVNINDIRKRFIEARQFEHCRETTVLICLSQHSTSFAISNFCIINTKSSVLIMKQENCPIG